MLVTKKIDIIFGNYKFPIKLLFSMEKPKLRSSR